MTTPDQQAALQHCLVALAALPDAEGNTPEETLEEYHGEVARWLREQ